MLQLTTLVSLVITYQTVVYVNVYRWWTMQTQCEGLNEEIKLECAVLCGLVCPTLCGYTQVLNY